MDSSVKIITSGSESIAVSRLIWFPPPLSDTFSTTMAFSAPTISNTWACVDPFAFVPRPSAVVVYITETLSLIFPLFSAAIAMVSSTNAPRASPLSSMDKTFPNVRKADAMLSMLASMKMTGIPI